MNRRVTTALLAVIALLSIAAVNPMLVLDQWTSEAREHAHKVAYAASAEIPTTTVRDIPCVDGMAGEFACDGLDLVAFMPTVEFGGTVGEVVATADVAGLISGNSDVWGWTDPETGDEIAIIGHSQGTAFIRVNAAEGGTAAPVYLGSVPNTAAAQLIWHDIKVIGDHALIVSESNYHGIQVFDMTTLRDIPDAVVAPQPLPLTGFYPLSVAQHNIVVNEAAEMAYIVGGNAGLLIRDECGGGLNAVDFSNPLAPTPAGCWTGDAYIHDAQCVRYELTDGVLPDPEHAGKDICMTYAEDRVSVVDMTDPANPELLSSALYEHTQYTHQGWFTEDFRYALANDELDEMDDPNVSFTRTLLVDTQDLDGIFIAEEFSRDGTDGNPVTVSIDHNNYTHGGLLYQSNYESGLRVIDVSGDQLDPDTVTSERSWDEVAFFDTYPADDLFPTTEFNGTWSNYPYFDSGVIAVSGIGEGIFFLRLQD